MVAEHRADYGSTTAVAKAVADQLGIGRETIRVYLLTSANCVGRPDGREAGTPQSSAQRDPARQEGPQVRIIPGRDGHRAGDLLVRNFTATAPDTRAGRGLHLRPHLGRVLCVAFVVDCYAQRIAGWHAATDKRTDLVLTPTRSRCETATVTTTTP